MLFFSELFEVLIIDESSGFHIYARGLMLHYVFPTILRIQI